MRALLLNSDYSPISFVSDIKAVCMLLNARVEIVVGLNDRQSLWAGETISTPSQNFNIPATIKLTKHVTCVWKPPEFHKGVMRNRDKWRCQYCGKRLTKTSTTIDHIIPSSRGGLTSWTNCVVACKPCNKKKGNKTPEEANMRLTKHPKTPTRMHFWNIENVGPWHDDWNCFLRA